MPGIITASRACVRARLPAQLALSERAPLPCVPFRLTTWERTHILKNDLPVDQRLGSKNGMKVVGSQVPRTNAYEFQDKRRRPAFPRYSPGLAWPFGVDAFKAGGFFLSSWTIRQTYIRSIETFAEQDKGAG